MNQKAGEAGKTFKELGIGQDMQIGNQRELLKLAGKKNHRRREGQDPGN